MGIETIAIVAAVGGAAVSAYGQMQAGEAASNAARYQAAVARNNAIISEQNAKLETQKGQQMEASKREQTAQVNSLHRARMAAAGLDIGSGTPVRIQEDIARVGELDALTIRNNAARSAYGYRSQGMGYQATAELDEMKSENAMASGQLGAFSSIIGGASSVSDKWLKFRTAGVESYGG